METPTFVALGSNQTTGASPPEAILRAALAALQSESVRLRAVSRFFSTPAFPAGAGPDYVNAVALLATPLAPEELLAHLHTVEAAFGRVRIRRWGARTLDLDLIASGQAVRPDPAGLRHWMDLPAADQQRLAPAELILPHPRLQDRAFVLVPLADVAPGWRHPLTGRTVMEMLKALPAAAVAEVCPL